MSTEPATRAGRRRRAGGGFTRMLAIVLAGLVVAGAVGAAVSLTQGPRVSAVAIDARAAAEAAGQRIVFTTNQPLAEIDPAQVSVEPAAAFTLEAAGRNVAVEFTYPLDPDTEYRVEIAGVEGSSGGPTATLAHSFTTGIPPLYVLQRRADDDDVIFSSNLAGDEAVPVHTAAQIEDFRASRDGIVVHTTDADGAAALSVVTGEGDPAAFTMPGVGAITTLQAADHGGLVGYTYTDLDIGAGGGIEAALYLARMGDPAAEPTRIEVGEDARVVQWAFVPQTSALVVLTFDGQLRLVETRDLDAEPVLLGGALALSGVERGTGRVIVERTEGTVVLDLTDLSEEPLVAADGAEALGIPGPVTPTVEGATLRTFTQMGADGFPQSQLIASVAADGAVTPLLELTDRGDAVMQTCASPSGRYAAVIVAPDLAGNPYDLYTRPLPERLETTIVDTRDLQVVTTLQGTDISWCAVAMP
jgi:hypothetical protein